MQDENAAEIYEVQDEQDFDLEWPQQETKPKRNYAEIFNLVLGHKQVSRVKEQHVRIIKHLDNSMREKLAFMLGVQMIWVCAFVIGRYPHLIGSWYLWHAVVLLSVRWITYKQQSLHYFCFDLCYFVNILALWWLFVAPQTPALYMAAFCLSHGPVMWAILAWRNSLVFHSLDKVTSLFIHIAPSLTFYCLRWFVVPLTDDNGVEIVTAGVNDHLTHGRNPLAQSEHMSFLSSLIYSLAFYAIWQLLYCINVLYAKREKIQSGQRVTSYSWLLDPERNKHRKNLMYLLCSVPGMAGKQQFWIQQLLFIFWQMMYALLTLLPTCLFYRFFWLHTAFILFIINVSIWNGACYYVKFHSQQKRLSQAQVQILAGNSSGGGGVDVVKQE